MDWSPPARTAGRRCASIFRAIDNALSRLIPAGFYYKTFMWPRKPSAGGCSYEHVIRHAAGMGRAASEPDPDHYEHQYAHCDVLVIGGGVAGLAAARAAASTRGTRHPLRRERAVGRRLAGARATIDDLPLADWIAAITRGARCTTRT